MPFLSFNSNLYIAHLFSKHLELYNMFPGMVVCHAAKNVGDSTHKCTSELHSPHHKEDSKSSTRRKNQVKVTGKMHGSHDRNKEAPEEIYRSLKNILQPSISVDRHSILPELEAAEEQGSGMIDFQI